MIDPELFVQAMEEHERHRVHIAVELLETYTCTPQGKTVKVENMLRRESIEATWTCKTCSDELHWVGGLVPPENLWI